MLNLAVQVADLNTAYFQPQNKKSKHGQHRENYHRDYYLKNREKFLTYSKEYYGVKKLLAPYLKEKERDQKEREKVIKREEKVLNNFLSHTRSSLTFARKNKERFFFKGWGVKEIGSSKEKLERRLDQEKIRLATQGKRPIKRGWTYDNFEEWLSKERLLNKYQEWSIRGGKKLGDKYLSFLDLDIEKENLEEWRKRQLRKNVELLLDCLGCFYVKTRKGYHIYLLTDELLPNSLLYHVDSWLKKEQIIGSIQSKGKYVVGFDSKDKKLIEKGSWFWHVKDLVGVKEKLGKFFIETGNREENTENKFLELQQKLRENQTKKINPIPYSKQNINHRQLRQEKVQVQAKVLSKYKTSLPYLWKTFYLDQKTKQTGYFLVNDYQRGQAFNNLHIGSTLNISLVQGYKHQFLSRASP